MRINLVQMSIVLCVGFIAIPSLSFAGDESIFTPDSQWLEKLTSKYPGIDKHELTIEPRLFDETFMVPMRDGVKLSTTVSKPPIGGPFPAILVRTSYGKEDLEQLELLLIFGYALVFQDARGTFGSEGNDDGFIHDGWGTTQDGYDTIEWIAQQSWCNGKIGTWGASVMGILSGLAAGAVPPSLDCQVITYAPTQGYGQSVYQNGVFREMLVEGWLTSHARTHLIPIFRSHPTLDDYWIEQDIESRHELINVPTFFIGGWYDCFQKGTINGFVGRQLYGAEGAKGNQKLLMGPWTHVGEFENQQGELQYPDNSVYDDEIGDTVEWFNYWLKDDDNDVENWPTIRYYVMGDVTDTNAPGNEFRTIDNWPPESDPVPLYLHSSGELSQSISLTNEKVSLVLDPENPIPTIGGLNLESSNSGPWDQSSIESRDDVLVFSSEVLLEPVEVVGEIKTILYASSNLTDNDLTVRLTDVYPDGRSMLVTDGIARASFRDSLSDPTPIVPDEIIRYEVDLWSTSLIFNKGHQIRILVANTNSPRFDLNPLFEQLGQNGNPDSALTQLHFSQEYPSQLLLPVISGLTNVHHWDIHETMENN
jgi:predicted acyl esterase